MSSKRKISLAISPCPNDTFIFDALIHQKIDTENLEFEYVLEDVQTLNQAAIDQQYDISKISYGLLPHILHNYVVLHSGSALGRGVGPLLISNKKIDITAVQQYPVAIPGKHTTANVLFSIFFPQCADKIFKIFHEIEPFVIAEKGLGVIIHENRFTYEQKGLHKIIDLGEAWEQKTNLPIPLGGIVAKRTLPVSLIKQIDRLIQKSVVYAFAHNTQLSSFVTTNAQEMSTDIILKHIQLYVNNYSIQLGEEGKQAIKALLTHLPQEHTIDFKEIFI